MIYLEAAYSYRKANTLFGGIFAISAGIVVSFIWWLFVNDETGLTSKPLLLCCLIPLSFSAFGVWMLWTWITSKKYLLKIDDEGITYKNKFREWGEISKLVCNVHMDGKVNLLYSTIKFLPNSNLSVDDLSEDDVRQLFSKLEESICPRYENLRLEGLQSLADINR